jgi:hypothetical protein
MRITSNPKNKGDRDLILDIGGPWILIQISMTHQVLTVTLQKEYMLFNMMTLTHGRDSNKNDR